MNISTPSNNPEQPNSTPVENQDLRSETEKKWFGISRGDWTAIFVSVAGVAFSFFQLKSAKEQWFKDNEPRFVVSPGSFDVFVEGPEILSVINFQKGYRPSVFYGRKSEIIDQKNVRRQALISELVFYDSLREEIIGPTVGMQTREELVEQANRLRMPAKLFIVKHYRIRFPIKNPSSKGADTVFFKLEVSDSDGTSTKDSLRYMYVEGNGEHEYVVDIIKEVGAELPQKLHFDFVITYYFEGTKRHVKPDRLTYLPYTNEWRQGERSETNLIPKLKYILPYDSLLTPPKPPKKKSSFVLDDSF